MGDREARTLYYKRSHFVTHLPVDYLYSPSHFWIGRGTDKTWRVGLTRFATRMLGEMVDHGFEIELGQRVEPGQIVGWVEGFKAISDVYCIGAGTFSGGNRLLQEKISLITSEGYGEGWLYALEGQPDSRCVDVNAYKVLLDQTIDRILEKQQGDRGH